MKIKQLVFISLLIILTGCESIKTLQASGGSKSDGIVELSYEVGMFQKAVVNWDDALKTAHERCTAWGFSYTRGFGGQTSRCQSWNNNGNCTSTVFTVKYQCHN